MFKSPAVKEILATAALIRQEAARIRALDPPVATGEVSSPSFSRSQQAALAELKSLNGYLRKGRRVAAFEPFRLSFEDWAWIRRELARGEARGLVLARAKTRIECAVGGPPAHAVRRARVREVALQTVAVKTATALGSLVRETQTGALGHPAFADQAARVMRGAFTAAYVAGHRNGTLRKQFDDEESDWDSLPPDTQEAISSAVADQHGFLQGLVQDLVAGMSVAALGARLDNYGNSATPWYEQGYQDSVVSQVDQGSGVTATWVTLAADPCGLCAARDGQSWPVEEAPLPGDGGFGEICEGAFNCRCVLDYEPALAEAA